MIKVIDNLIDFTDWSQSGASQHALTGMESFSAGGNETSLMFRFSSAGDYIEKTFDEDVSDYEEIILWAWSRNLGQSSYKKAEDFYYKIDFGEGKEYYLPVTKGFYYIRIKIDFDNIDRLRITSLTDNEDYLVLSYFIVNKNVFPYDIFNSVKTGIENYIEDKITLKTIGTISGSSGDSSISFSSPVSYLDRYAVIEISDGVNSEKHGIISRKGNEYTFSQLYDGDSLVNDFTDATVYLYYPVEFGTDQKEIIFPSITVWGFTPERKLITNELDNILDTFKTDDTFQERQVGQYLNWLLLIDCTCKEEWEVLGTLSEIVRKVIGRKTIWVNGRRCYIDFSAPPVLKEPTESFDIIPEIQYSANIEIREELYDSVTLPKTTDINVSFTITEQGEV